MKVAHKFVLNREGEYLLPQENIRLRDRGDICSLDGRRRRRRQNEYPGHPGGRHRPAQPVYIGSRFEVEKAKAFLQGA